MLTNYFIVAWRNLVRNKLSLLINTGHPCSDGVSGEGATGGIARKA